MTSSDYMARALFHAGRGRGRTSPNPLVGAVVVSADDIVVGYGYHERAGEAHAEVRALDMAGSRAKGSTLYCNLEPCCHVGRTGPCVVRIVEADVARVVAATEDPDPLVRGRGFAFLREHGVRVEVGPEAETATLLNQPFFTRIREERPFVTLKAAVSLDGHVAAEPGRPTALTSAQANRHAHAFRAEVDAIAVGVGTVLADDPQLTARGAYRAQPLVRVVFDRQLRLPPEARVLSTGEAGPVIIVTTAAAAGRAERRLPAARTARCEDHHHPGRHAARGTEPPGRRLADRIAPARRRRRHPRICVGRKASSTTSGCTSRRTCWDRVDSLFSPVNRSGPRRCSSGGSSRWGPTC